jgi:hypothetical protein
MCGAELQLVERRGRARHLSEQSLQGSHVRLDPQLAAAELEGELLGDVEGVAIRLETGRERPVQRLPIADRGAKGERLS